MVIQIDSHIKHSLPGFKLGCIEYKDTTVSETPKMVSGKINLFLSNLRLDYGNDGLTQIRGIKEWRQGFKSLGMDPSKYRPSSEALIKRALQEKPMYWINGVVDINNLLSMKYALPFGIYNRDKIEGDSIICRLGLPGETYEGLNGRETSMEGKLLLSDASGPYGSPIVDSVRTSIGEDANHLIQFVFIHPQFSIDECTKMLEETAALFTQVNGGTVVFQEVIE